MFAVKHTGKQRRCGNAGSGAGLLLRVRPDRYFVV
jgi:hypothetical protein